MARLIAALLVLGLLLSCSGEKKDDAAAGQETGEATTQTEGRQMIPDDGPSEFDQLMQAYIKPYFDAEGTVSELAVAPGETFTIYVFGEYNKMYPMSATEFMMALPEGVYVMNEAKSDSAVMAVGSYRTDYMMTFRCAEGPRFMMMRYECNVGDSFAGGSVEIKEGSVHHFLGFTLCDEARTLVEAKPGSAKLTRK